MIQTEIVRRTAWIHADWLPSDFRLYLLKKQKMGRDDNQTYINYRQILVVLKLSNLIKPFTVVIYSEINSISTLIIEQ